MLKHLSKMLKGHQLKEKYILKLREIYHEDNFYSPKEFKQRLTLEQRRTERFETSSSIITFTLNHQNEKKKSSKTRHHAIKNLLKIICSNLRETDVVSLFNDDKIIILLPDTDIKNAKYVYQILNKQIAEYKNQQSSKKHNLICNFEVEITPIPEKPFDEQHKLTVHQKQPNKLPIKENYTYSNHHTARNSTFSFQSSLAGYFTISPYGGSSLVLEMVSTQVFDSQLINNLFFLIQKGIKRGLDIFGSITLLALLAPMLLTVALLIKLTSKGPILFTQTRLGLNGTKFKLLKFRSMYHNSKDNVHKEYIKKLIQGKEREINNGNHHQPLFKIKDDPRITSIGRFIRKTSIDELPQLWNVLKGEMSLIGPRPPIPYEVESYKNWHLRRILEVKPGLSGLWQISGRNSTTFDEMVRLDIKYIKNWSLLLDIKILFKTILLIFNPNGN